MSETPLPVQIQSQQLWHDFARYHKVDNLSIYQLQRYDSASKIKNSQYLALRAIWKFERPAIFKPRQWGIIGVGSAQNLLKEQLHWQDFLRMVPKKFTLDELIPIRHQLGEFKTTWYLQQQIRWASDFPPDHEGNLVFSPPSSRTRAQLLKKEQDLFLQSPTRSHVSALTKKFMDIHLTEAKNSTSSTDYGRQDEFEPETPQDDHRKDPTYEEYEEEDSFPPVSDENVVNTFLVNFMNAITISIEGVKAHWTQQRKGFKVTNQDGTKVYEARTDGHLFVPKSTNSKVIIEVKPFMRNDSTRVMMQETAQMVAWIHAEPDDITGESSSKRFRRLLISQNRHEIYIIIAEYDSEYIDYITNPHRGSQCLSFLRMNEFGPWNIAIAADVENIASILLAVTLQLGNCLSE